MTAQDGRGLPVTARSAAEIAALDYFVARLARIDRGAEAILEAARIFPETPMVQLCAAAFCLFGQTPASEKAAAAYLDAGAPLLPSAHDRERRFHHALTRWLHRDHLAAAAALEEMTLQWPRDLLAAKIAEFLYYVLGQQQEGPRFLLHMKRLAEANAGDPDFLAAFAFAHELCGEADMAERIAQQALDIDIHTPWAHHCLAHVYLRRGAAEEGVRRLQEFLPLWMGGGRVIHCHNAWHLGVAYLETLALEPAQDMLRHHVWGIAPDFVGEIVDAIALAWRIEMAGGRADALWPTFADHATAHAGECYMPFLNAHFAFALARAGRNGAVANCLARMRERAAADDAEAWRTWRPMGVALVEAAAAFGRGEAGRSADLLGPIIEKVTFGGGSDAQVDLFRQTYFQSLPGANRRADAKAYWSKQTAGRKLTELDRSWMARAA